MNIRDLLAALVFLGCAIGLCAELPEGYPSGFHRLEVAGPCGYSYGVASDGEDVYYTDFNAGSLVRLSGDGKCNTVLSNMPGIYGLAAGDGLIFYATDGDQKNAAIHRFRADAKPESLAEGLTRPRQLFLEEQGTLLFALEGEARIARLDVQTKKLETVVDAALVPQAAVSDGNEVLFTEYGQMKGDGTPVIQGRVSLVSHGAEPQTELLKVWRARGLARLGPGRFAVLSEADQQDHGNSASLQVFDRQGQVSLVVKGFDYPQFTAVDAQGNVLTTAPRDRVILRFLTGTPPVGEEKLVELGENAAAFAAVRGFFADESAVDAEEIRIIGGRSGDLAFRMRPDEKGRIAGWIRMTEREFPELSRRELKYPDPVAQVFTPGVFALPNLRVQRKDGSMLKHHVLAQRRNQGCRWPMTNVGKGHEAPAAGYSEEPVAYLVYFEGEL
jgi:hypothetical protein